MTLVLYAAKRALDILSPELHDHNVMCLGLMRDWMKIATFPFILQSKIWEAWISFATLFGYNRHVREFRDRQFDATSIRHLYLRDDVVEYLNYEWDARACLDHFRELIAGRLWPAVATFWNHYAAITVQFRVAVRWEQVISDVEILVCRYRPRLQHWLCHLCRVRQYGERSLASRMFQRYSEGLDNTWN